MDSSVTLSRGVVALVVVVTLVTGPVVGITPSWFHEEETDVRPGQGTATVEVVDVPDRVVLDRSEFGAGWYRLEVPAAIAHVSDVEGQPMLSYQVRIEALGTDQGSTTFLSPATEGAVALEMSQWRYEPSEVTEDAYAGELTVTYRGSDGTRTLVQKDVTVEVRG